MFRPAHTEYHVPPGSKRLETRSLLMAGEYNNNKPLGQVISSQRLNCCQACGGASMNADLAVRQVLNESANRADE